MTDMESWTGLAIADTARYNGTVKSYNGLKMFGFISCDAVVGDVFFLMKDLAPDSKEVQGKYMDGRSVTFAMDPQADGRHKAKEVQIQCDRHGENEVFPGIIKTFSDKNGYGFIQSSHAEGDLRFDRQAFAAYQPGLDLTGKLVLFAIQTLPDGKLRATKVEFQSGRTARAVSSGEDSWNAQAGKGAWNPAVEKGAWNPAVQKGAWNPAVEQGAWNPAVQKGGKGAWSPNVGSGKGGKDIGGLTQGMVKSFSAKNGYGFISAQLSLGPGYPETQQDVKFGMETLWGDPPSPGTAVWFKAKMDSSGRLSASEVAPAGGVKRAAPAVDEWGGYGGYAKGGYGAAWAPKGGKDKQWGPYSKGGGKGVPGAPVQTTSTGQTISGSIKSFNPSKGFGFIDSPSGDVFFMKTDLPPNASVGLAPGTVVSFELMQTSDNKMRASGITLG